MTQKKDFLIKYNRLAEGEQKKIQKQLKEELDGYVANCHQLKLDLEKELKKLSFVDKYLSHGKPKKPLTSYLQFCNHLMTSSPQELPTGFRERAAFFSQRWKELPESERKVR